MFVRLAQYALLFTLLTAASPALWAQTANTLFPIKFVCGHSAGTVPSQRTGAAPNSLFRILQAGNYSTAVNILHNQLTADVVSFFAIAEGYNGVPVINQLNMAAFESTTVICPEIQGAFGISAETEVEGWLIMAASSPDFSVEVVYTYANYERFIDHRYRQVTGPSVPFFTLFPQGPEDTTLITPGLPIVPLPVATPANPSGDYAVAGSGAGGAGIGASIDVEKVEPVALNEPINPDQIIEFIRQLD